MLRNAGNLNLSETQVALDFVFCEREIQEQVPRPQRRLRALARLVGGGSESEPNAGE